MEEQKSWKSKLHVLFLDLYVKYTLYRLIQKNALALWGSNSSAVPTIVYLTLRKGHFTLFSNSEEKIS